MILTIFLLGANLLVNQAVAETTPLKPDTEINMYNQEGTFLSAAGLNSNTTIGSIAALIIEALLGLLAIIFIALLIYAGIQWMTAEGNEEKVDKAKQTIFRAVIGLIIVISAYALTYFVFNALNGTLGGAVRLG